MEVLGSSNYQGSFTNEQLEEVLKNLNNNEDSFWQYKKLVISKI
jgi:hypothetical protein